MKKYFTALCALAIALLLTVPAAAEDGVNSSGTTSLSDVLNDIDFDSDNSIQLMFAKLSWHRRSSARTPPIPVCSRFRNFRRNRI